VLIMDEEKIEATGAISGDELLQSIPQIGDMMFSNTDTASNLNAARGDVGSINLRNLGTGNTLLMVNGRRMVPHPGTQTESLVPRQTANINAIPLFGTRRVETLLGGASALYGSDAVAGVVNVVLDTHYQGSRCRPSTAAPRTSTCARATSTSRPASGSTTAARGRRCWAAGPTAPTCRRTRATTAPTWTAAR